MGLAIIPCSNAKGLAEGLAKKLGADLAKHEHERFKDGEFKIRVIGDVINDETLIVQSGYPHPGDSLWEVFFAIDIAEEHGAKSVKAVIPYLPYARQDKRFVKDGREAYTEALSLKSIARHLAAENLDLLVTADLHPKGVLDNKVEGKYKLYDVNAYNITAGDVIADYVNKKYKDEEVLLVSPDAGAADRVKFAANATGMEYTVLGKARDSDVDVRGIGIEDHADEIRGRNVLVLDDIISTGGTMATQIEEMRSVGCKKVYIGATHGLFIIDPEKNVDAHKTLTKVSDEIIVTDAVPIKYEDVTVVSLVDKIAEVLG